MNISTFKYAGRKWKSFDVDIFVVDVDGVTLIRRKTGVRLGILKIAVQTIQERAPLLQWDKLKKTTICGCVLLSGHVE